MRKKYIVRLSAAERAELSALVNKGREAARKRRHAEILRKADGGEGGPGWKDERSAEAFAVGRRTVERVRQRLVEEGLAAALNERPKSRHRRPVLEGDSEARLVALACSEAPAGHSRWTLKLLADRLVELEYVDRVSPETVRRVLKKRAQTVAAPAMVHSGASQRRLWLRDGRYSGGVSG